ncbi:PepSY domain-containing protein [Sedimenticola selenatireducens]|uniref:PepSY domain-containing protein n=1 Tax=Sedimenticola selenatireducens TaxID=191960 RepID=UPI0004BA7491
MSHLHHDQDRFLKTGSEENGRIIEVERERERERERGRDPYEIKLVGSDGRVREIKVDVESGEVIDRD